MKITTFQVEATTCTWLHGYTATPPPPPPHIHMTEKLLLPKGTFNLEITSMKFHCPGLDLNHDCHGGTH